MLGTLQAINYSILYNAGNATRAQNLAILQQEVEKLRAAKFTPTGIDSAALPGTGACRTDDQRDITGGPKQPCTITAANGNIMTVNTWVDDNPFNAADTFDVNTATEVKEITVEVRLAAPSPGWQRAIPARVVLRRAIGN
jgi:hypothetical protein